MYSELSDKDRYVHLRYTNYDSQKKLNDIYIYIYIYIYDVVLLGNFSLIKRLLLNTITLLLILETKLNE